MSEPAEQARAMGLAVGDTVEGREQRGPYWDVTRLTLLWLGEHVAVWSATSRWSDDPEWSEPEETADWTLDGRPWQKVQTEPHTR